MCIYTYIGIISFVSPAVALQYSCDGTFFATRTSFCFGHGCSKDRMLLEHARYYGLDMDALVTVCSWNTKRDNGLGMDDLVTVCS